MRVYNLEDKSLVEYYSEAVSDLDNIEPNSEYVKEFSRFYNCNYEVVANLEDKLTKQSSHQAEDNVILNEVEEALEGYNMLSLFSLAKIKSAEP
jgi:hypothetical protein